VLGTLYHVVPFIVWVHRYSDLLGFEDVPMIDDLYDARVARADFLLLVAALLLLTADGLVGLPDAAVAAAGTAFLVGAALFVGNMALVVREHSPDTVAGILAGRTGGSGGGADTGRGGPGD
jgi:hypothetical protein